MSKLVFIICAALALTGCTTPKTMLKNDKTGQVVSCGGSSTASIFGGAIGYHMQKSNDEDCQHDFIEQGFKVIKRTEY